MSEESGSKEIATREIAAPVTLNDAGILMPSNLDGLWRLSAVMAKSGLMPKGMNTVENVFVAIQFGFELGISPVMSVQNIAAINGRPSLYGDIMLAIVLKSGTMEEYREYSEGGDLFPNAKYENSKLIPGDPNIQYKAIFWAKRKGKQEPIVQEYSVMDAITAGLWGKEGPWRTNPKRMLKFRARGFALRDGWSDHLKGMVSREEAEDFVELEQVLPGRYERLPEIAAPSFPCAPGNELLDIGKNITEDYFWAALKERGIPNKLPNMVSLLDRTAEHFSKSVPEIMHIYLSDPQAMKGFLDAYAKSHQPQTQAPKKEDPPKETPKPETAKPSEAKSEPVKTAEEPPKQPPKADPKPIAGRPLTLDITVNGRPMKSHGVTGPQCERLEVLRKMKEEPKLNGMYWSRLKKTYEVTTPNYLTEAEASELIEAMEKLLPQPKKEQGAYCNGEGKTAIDGYCLNTCTTRKESGGWCPLCGENPPEFD